MPQVWPRDHLLLISNTVKIPIINIKTSSLKHSQTYHIAHQTPGFLPLCQRYKKFTLPLNVFHIPTNDINIPSLMMNTCWRISYIKGNDPSKKCSLVHKGQLVI